MTSLDGRRFRPPDNVTGGDVGVGTLFRFHQDGDMVWAEYEGGRVRKGFLVGTTADGYLEFRYTQLLSDGTTANGWSRDRIEVLSSGLLRLHEAWRWESKVGAGTSILAEVAEDELSVPAGGGDLGELGEDADRRGIELG